MYTPNFTCQGLSIDVEKFLDHLLPVYFFSKIYFIQSKTQKFVVFFEKINNKQL